MDTKTSIPDKICECPSCHCTTCFRYVGEQEYPLAVALAAGFSTNRFTLWMCGNCETSMLETALTLPVMQERAV